VSGENLVFEHFFTHAGMTDAGHATALAVEAATGDIGIWTAFHPMQVSRVGVLITVAINYDTLTTKAVIAFDRRVTYGSDTGRVEMGRVSIPDATAAGTVIYLDIPNGEGNDNGEVLAGQQVVAEIVTQGAGGTEVGDFQPFVCWQPMAVAPGNNKDGNGVQTLVPDTTTTQV
jgi:hypothetical protein